jgi:predicted HTH domain antitoxin
MVNIVTNSNLHYADGEERVNMCEAIEGIRNDAVLETLIGLVKDGLLSLNVAAERANMTVEEFKEKTAELNN